MAIITKTFKIGIGDDETSVQPSADKIVKRDSNGDILTYKVGFYDAPNDEYQYISIYDDVLKVGINNENGFDFDFYDGTITNYRTDTTGTFTYTLPNKNGTFAMVSDITDHFSFGTNYEVGITALGENTALQLEFNNDDGYFLCAKSGTTRYFFDVENTPANTDYHISYPAKSGTIALLSDIPSSTDTWREIKVANTTKIASTSNTPLDFRNTGNVQFTWNASYNYLEANLDYLDSTPLSSLTTKVFFFHHNTYAYAGRVYVGDNKTKYHITNLTTMEVWEGESTSASTTLADVVSGTPTTTFLNETNGMQYKNTSSVSNLNSLASVVANREKMDGNVYILTDSGNLTYYAGSLAVKQYDMVMFSYGGGTQWGWRLLPTLYSEQTFTGKKTFSFSGSDTPMYVETTQSGATATYIGFNKSGTNLGYIGITTNHTAVFYWNGDHEIALKDQDNSFGTRQTINFSTDNNPLKLNSTYSGSNYNFISFAQNGTTKGQIGVDLASQKPVFRNPTTNITDTIALTDDVLKSLYHLGAFDTYVDNGDGTTTITRQTGYLRVNDVLSELANNRIYAPSGHLYYIYALPNATQETGSAYTKVNGGNVVEQWGHNDTYPSNNFEWYRENGLIQLCGTSSDVSSLAPFDISIQYKLNYSYTEKVITGRPINTLDKQGSGWLRSEWEKTQNLFPYNNVSGSQTGSPMSAWNGVYIEALGKYIEVGKTYTISLNITQTAGQVGLEVRKNNTYWKSTTSGATSGILSITFTADEVSSYDLVFFYNYSSSSISKTATYSNIMLNEGDHAYSYQKYQGEVVHRAKMFDIYEMASANNDVSSSPTNAQLPTYDVGGLSSDNKTRLFNITVRCVERGYIKFSDNILFLNKLNVNIANKDIGAIFGGIDNSGDISSIYLQVDISGSNYSFYYVEV